MANGTSHSRRIRTDESRVERLHRQSGRGGDLIRRPRLDYYLELKTIIVFAIMIGVTAAVFIGLDTLGYTRPDSDNGLILAFALGIIVTCAFSSSLAFLLALRHMLLIVAAAALAITFMAFVLGWNPLEGLAKVIFATALGLWISLMLTSIGQIIIIAGLIILVDFYSVFLGPTKKIVESGGDWIDYLTIKLPVFGAPAVSQIGISDIVFFSLFVGVSINYSLRRSGTAFALTVSFVATMVAGVSLEIGVPALPLLSVFFMLANADILYQRFLEEPDDRGRGRAQH